MTGDGRDVRDVDSHHGTQAAGAGAATVELDPGDRRLAQALRDTPKDRARLTRETGWSRNTVAARLNHLMDLGWISTLAAPPRAERGRPSTLYSLDPEARLFFIVRFGPDALTGVIASLRGKVRARAHSPLPSGYTSADAVGQLTVLRDRLISEAEVAKDRVAAMVLGVPGPVHGHTKTVPWSKVGVLPEALAEIMGMPVLIENDANLMALGARGRVGPHESLLYVFIDIGIGAGLIVAGELHRGRNGWAGEIGHIPVTAGGDIPCICGGHGCVAQVAANPALIRDVSTPERPIANAHALALLAENGDLGAIAALRAAGRSLGEALTGPVIGLTPDLILTGGTLASVGGHLQAGLTESLTRRLPPALAGLLRMEDAEDPDADAIRGATDLGFALLFGTGTVPGAFGC